MQSSPEEWVQQREQLPGQAQVPWLPLCRLERNSHRRIHHGPHSGHHIPRRERPLAWREAWVSARRLQRVALSVALSSA